MDKMDFFGKNDEIDFEKAEIERREYRQLLKVVCTAIEDSDYFDNLTTKEAQFYALTRWWWMGQGEIKGLTDKQKKVVFYYLVQKFSIQEIAIHLNTDKSSIYKILKRAMKKSKKIAEIIFNN